MNNLGKVELLAHNSNDILILIFTSTSKFLLLSKELILINTLIPDNLHIKKIKQHLDKSFSLKLVISVIPDY